MGTARLLNKLKEFTPHRLRVSEEEYDAVIAIINEEQLTPQRVDVEYPQAAYGSFNEWEQANLYMVVSTIIGIAVDKRASVEIKQVFSALNNHVCPHKEINRVTGSPISPVSKSMQEGGSFKQPKYLATKEQCQQVITDLLADRKRLMDKKNYSLTDADITSYQSTGKTKKNKIVLDRIIAADKIQKQCLAAISGGATLKHYKLVASLEALRDTMKSTHRYWFIGSSLWNCLFFKNKLRITSQEKVITTLSKIRNNRSAT